MHLKTISSQEKFEEEYTPGVVVMCAVANHTG